jgi:putative flippase GtrA
VSVRLGEAARFGVVGLAAYGVDVLLFNALLLAAGTPSVMAKVVSSAAAIAVAFAGSRWWTWRHRRGPRIGRESALFVVFSVLAAGIQLGCLVLSRQVLDLRSAVADNVSANVVGMALATLFRFWTFRTYVFPPRTDHPSSGPATDDVPADDARPDAVGPRLRSAAGGRAARGRGAARS